MARRDLTFALLASLAVACSSDSDEPAGPSGTPQSAVVQATPQITFTPAQVTIQSGGTVTWQFGSVPHNLFFEDAPGTPQDIPGFNSNTSFSRTFDTEGTFDYECMIHPGMRGSVVVSSAASSAVSTKGGAGTP